MRTHFKQDGSEGQPSRPNYPDQLPQPLTPDPRSRRRKLFFILLLIVLAVLVGGSIFIITHQQEDTKLSTSAFIEALSDNRIVSVTYDRANGTVSGWHHQKNLSSDSEETFRRYTATIGSEETFTELMKKYPIDYNMTGVPEIGTSTSPTGGILNNLSLILMLIMVVLAIASFILIYRQKKMITERMSGNGENMQPLAELPDVKFSDVAGIDEAVEEVQEIKEFLMNPAKFEAMGAKIPHGILLAGDPGCGKTLLAKAIAGEAGVAFYTSSGSEYVEKYVGVGASRIREVFDEAAKNSPSIIFIDEIDAVGRARSENGEGNDERDSTLNQLLVAMDGFKSDEHVIVIGATNRPDMLDPALLRPGRFDRQIMVTSPDVKGRREILSVHSQNKPMADDLTLEDIAAMTSGFSGADLANLLNEAAILAVRSDKDKIGKPEIDEAFERTIAGPAKKAHVMTDIEKRTIAYHEAGHALVGHFLDNADPIKKITIAPRGKALGYTLSIPEEDHFLMTRDQMNDELAMLLGGRVAEEICNKGNVTTGASNDIERVTHMARSMVTRYGMSERLGAYVYGSSDVHGLSKDYSSETALIIDEEVRKLVDAAHEKAFKILSKYSNRLNQMAQVLMERESIDGDAVEALLEGRWEEFVASETARAQKASDADGDTDYDTQADCDVQSHNGLDGSHGDHTRLSLKNKLGEMLVPEEKTQSATAAS